VSAILTLPDGKQIPVVDGMIIGRDRGAGVVLADTKASRRHARLISQGGVVELEDMDSSNGTLLNGKPVEKRMLRDGDEIQIGTTKIRFGERVESRAVDTGGFSGGDDLFGGEPDPPADEPADKPAEAFVGKPIEKAPEPAAAEPAQRTEDAPFDPVVEVRKPSDAEPQVESEVLEFADDDVVVVKRTAADLAPKKARKEAAQARPAGRDGGVLQFSKIEDKRGLAVQDLGQMSSGMRGFLILVAIVVAAGLFYLAMMVAG
jgi:predicted component of type VI protein secretion system